MTASYLSGYSITKSAKDFGWPDSSLTVVARPVAAPKIALKASQTYFQISRLEKGKSIKAYITTKGKKYPAEEFAELTLKLDTEGLGYSVTPLPEESAFEIKLDKSGKVDPGKYKINAVVSRTDDLGKEWKSKDSCTVQLRSIPLWLLWLLILLILIILAIIIYVVAHIKHLPTKLHASTKPGHRDMNVGGVDETGATIFRAGITDSVLKVETNFAGSTNGVRMGIEPGTDAILAKKAVKKKIRVKASTVRAFGAANIEEVNVGNKQYIVNPETGKLESAIGDTNDFELSHNNTVTYSGTMLRNGVEEPFFATVKLDFKKK